MHSIYVDRTVIAIIVVNSAPYQLS